MKKARRIKAGVLAFTAVVSVAVTSVPVYAVEDSPVVYDLKAEQKNQENLEYDQAALDLLKYCNKDDFINMIYSYMGCGSVSGSDERCTGTGDQNIC